MPLISSTRHFLAEYFNISADLVPQADAEKEIRAGVSFKGTQLLILIFAIFIASLGLNTNSIPVIIGAMLISPLMGPIIGMGLGMGVEDFPLLKRSLRNLTMAVAGSLAASALYFLCSPLYEGSSQLLARTSPTIYDVLVGLFGGAAGIVSIGSKTKGQVMPGVAIATSLMPPLCTAGYGLATWQANFFFGALYLFFINATFILFASWVGVKVMKYHAAVDPNEKRSRRIQSLMVLIVTVTIALSIFLTYRMIRKSSFLNQAQEFVKECMVFPNTQVLTHEEYLEKGHGVISVTLIGEALPLDSLHMALTERLDSMGLGGTRLILHQGFSIRGTMVQPDDSNKDLAEVVTMLQDRIIEKQGIIDSLRSVISAAEYSSKIGAEILPELKIMAPSVQNIALSEFYVTSANDSIREPAKVDMALLRVGHPLSASERDMLSAFLKLRLDRPTLQIYVNPPGFRWEDEP